MATIREYYDLDSSNVLTVHSTWKTADGSCEIGAKIAYDFEANAKYWYFYIPHVSNLPAVLGSLFGASEVASCQLGPQGDGVEVAKGFSDYSDKQSNATLVFTKRIHLYLDFDGTPAERASLAREVLAKGYFVTVRDREYARKRSEAERPRAFIAHDTRDKDSFVRELARELLTKHRCFVWYDEYSLKVGDSLRESIERGLREAEKCIVVLSPNFLSNKGWSKAEFDSIFTREIVHERNVMLPVWLNVNKEGLFNYSPRLLDKLGIDANLGVEEVARQLALAINSSARR
jgi:hypothetical protein